MAGMMVDTLFPSKLKSGDELRCVALKMLMPGEAAVACNRLLGFARLDLCKKLLSYILLTIILSSHSKTLL